MNDFKPGIYEHYKGALYRALGLCVHHESRQLYVIYVSLEKGTVNIRPLVAIGGDEDAWTDFVGTGMFRRPRFAFVGDGIE